MVPTEDSFYVVLLFRDTLCCHVGMTRALETESSASR